MADIYLEIRNADSAISFLTEARKAGMLKDISMEAVKCRLAKADYPICIPINLDGILALAANPIVRKTFGKKLEAKTVDILTAALGAGH